MIIHRARVCENEAERQEIMERLENGETLQRTREGHTNPQQQELGLDEIQQEPSIWRLQPISDGPGGQGKGGGQQVLIVLHRSLGQQKDDSVAEDEGRWEPLDQSQITDHYSLRTENLLQNRLGCSVQH